MLAVFYAFFNGSKTSGNSAARLLIRQHVRGKRVAGEQVYTRRQLETVLCKYTVHFAELVILNINAIIKKAMDPKGQRSAWDYFKELCEHRG